MDLHRVPVDDFRGKVCRCSLGRVGLVTGQAELPWACRGPAWVWTGWGSGRVATR